MVSVLLSQNIRSFGNFSEFSLRSVEMIRADFLLKEAQMAAL
jgi:hypothetical protein